MKNFILIIFSAALLVCLISCSETTANEIKTTAPLNTEASVENSPPPLMLESKIDLSFSSADDLVKWINTVDTKTFSELVISSSMDGEADLVRGDLNKIVLEMRGDGKMLYPFYNGEPVKPDEYKITISPGNANAVVDKNYTLYFYIDNNHYGFTVSFPDKEYTEYLNKGIDEYYRVKHPSFPRLDNCKSIEGYDDVKAKEVIINGKNTNCTLYDYTHESSRMKFVMDSKLIIVYFIQVEPISDEQLKIFENLTFEYYDLSSS